mgnify:CR=1 FL=1
MIGTIGCSNELKNKLVSSNINNYAFTGETKEDIYGMYYLFKPMNGDKYLTRKINVLDLDEIMEQEIELSKNNKYKMNTPSRVSFFPVAFGTYYYRTFSSFGNP